METMLYTAALDDRYGSGKVASRIGLEARAHTFDDKTDIFSQVTSELKKRKLNCVLIDEAQFLTRDQVFQLADICDRIGIPVLTYGIRTDFQANLFEGSMHLLALADELKELKTICKCGRKATMNLRTDENGKVIKEGEQTDIGGNDRYEVLCRKHFMELAFSDG